MPDANILIVDDEVELAENLADLLEFEGYNIEMSHSGEDALEKVAANKPDIVLLDIQLPGLSGIEVLEKLKAEYSGLPVVMVSASSQPQTREKVDRLGADGMVLKPYDQDDLLGVIAGLLEASSG